MDLCETGGNTSSTTDHSQRSFLGSKGNNSTMNSLRALSRLESVWQSRLTFNTSVVQSRTALKWATPEIKTYLLGTKDFPQI